jgi:hypothetical protein
MWRLLKVMKIKKPRHDAGVTGMDDSGRLADG